MSAPILFISDLHLDASRPDITAQFLAFLRGEARTASALYILGDLFEIWIGDDDPDSEKQKIQDALLEYTRSGIPCFVMHGNRDFLIGSQFLRRTGCTLLTDPCVVSLFGKRVLLLHGDLLCTDDRAYQRLRRIVRNPLVQWIMRRLPLSRRLALATKMRAGSRAHIDQTMNSSMSAIMDVNQDAVTQTFAAHGVDTMIHGHTHRPAIHTVQLTSNSTSATRIVLGDWYDQGSVLRLTDSGHQLLSLSRT